MYEFDLQNTILNKEQPKQKFISRSHPPLPIDKVCYYIATHTAEKTLAGTNASFKVLIEGTKRIIGKSII